MVAVEPNPSLANEIKNKYLDLISQGKLIVKNAAIVKASESVQESTIFFVNRLSDVGSTLLSNPKSDDYYPITVSTVSCTSLVQEYGHPYFVKIDIEGMDEDILADMFRYKIFPKYLQAEFYPGSDVLSVMARHGGYSRFRFIDGPSVSRRYKKVRIKTVSNGNEYFQFAHGTAGPFGSDIHGTPMQKLVLRLILCLRV